jgi:nucleotide-binding universal stress UspA family protein
MTGNTERAGGRIVVGVDSTASSLIAVRWAAQEALLRQASVHLVHVSRQYPRASYSGSPDASPTAAGGADRSAQLAAADLEAGRRGRPGDHQRVTADRRLGHLLTTRPLSDPATATLSNSRGPRLWNGS